MTSAPVAPLAADQLFVFLAQVATLLALALILGRCATRLGLPAIVGELAAGVLVGPTVLGHLWPWLSGRLLPPDPQQAHLTDAAAQLGLLLLVGISAAQLDPTLLRRRGATAVRISLAGLVIPLTLGVLVGFLLPASLIPGGTERAVFAAFIGVAMCVTAIPVIAKTLSDMNLLHRNVGQLTLVSGVVDDAVGWFLLSLVVAMATVGLDGGHVAVSVLTTVGFVLAAYVVGRPLVRRLFALAGRSADSGPTVATAAVVILVGGAITHGLGMEAVFGAFVAGMLIGAPGVVAPERLAPLRTVVLAVLAPLFMATAGLRIDLTALARPSVAVTAVVVLTIAIVGKFVGAYIGARASRLTHWEGLALGAGMNARGVVEVVVAMVGLRLGVLTSEMFTIVVLMALVTSLMAPPLLRLIMPRVERDAEEELRQERFAAWTVPQHVTTSQTGRGE